MINSKIEHLYQLIGNYLLDFFGENNKKILAYAEAEDNVISVSIFFSKAGEDIPVFEFGDEKLSELFYLLWEEWSKTENGRWAGIEYFLDNGKPAMVLIYPEKFDLSINVFSRRLISVKKYFNQSKIDYSKIT